jgi:hypothetical protein
MSRTKTRARKGHKGHEYRENMLTEAGRLENKENKKRKREERKAGEVSKSDSSQTQPSKKVKTTSSTAKTTALPSHPASKPESDSPNELVNTSPPVDDLATDHEVTTMSILSTAHIQQKVTRVLGILSTFPHIPPAKPGVVLLHSKASVASKMITITEIAKREITKSGGKWFQYSRVESVMVEEKKGPKKTDMKLETATKGKEEDSMVVTGMDDPESEEATEAFETMKTPFERAIEGRPKLRAVPVMMLYLSRIRIDSLRKAYG